MRALLVRIFLGRIRIPERRRVVVRRLSDPAGKFSAGASPSGSASSSGSAVDICSGRKPSGRNHSTPLGGTISDGDRNNGNYYSCSVFISAGNGLPVTLQFSSVQTESGADLLRVYSCSSISSSSCYSSDEVQWSSPGAPSAARACPARWYRPPGTCT
jgi:hypothetical protein